MNMLGLILVVLVLAVLMRVASAWSRFGQTLPFMLLAALLFGAATWAVFVPVQTRQKTVRLPDGGAQASDSVEASPSASAAGYADEREDPDDDAIILDTELGKATGHERPAWVDRGPMHRGNVYQVPVASGPQETIAECRPALDQQLTRAVADYIDEYLGASAAGDYRASDVVMYDLGYIKKDLVKPESTFEERLPVSLMYQTHALLEFGPEFRRQLDERHGDLERYQREQDVARRLRGLTVGFAAVCGLLAVGFGWLRRGPAAASSRVA